MIKQWFSFDKQADKLLSLGLKANKDDLVEFLKSYNYYFISGYLYEFRDKFSKQLVDEDGALTLDKVQHIIHYDSTLRSLCLRILDILERDLNTKIAYYCGETYGALGYLTDNQFISNPQHKNFCDYLDEYKTRNKDKDFVMHHMVKYNGFLPIWVAVEILPFGSLEKLFNFLDIGTKRKIAKYYNISDVDKFESWLNALVLYRNLLAHNHRLYRHIIKKRPKKSKIFSPWSTKVFDYIVIMKEMFPKNANRQVEWMDILNQFTYATTIATENFDVEDGYGIPNSYKTVLGV